MSKHSNYEKEVMLWLGKNYPDGRVFRMDAGQAYAKFSVNECINALLFQKEGVTSARKLLRIISYGHDGWPDLFFGRNSWSLGIEIKVGKDRQRESQKNIQEVFKMLGWGYVIVDDKSSIDDQLKTTIDGMIRR